MFQRLLPEKRGIRAREKAGEPVGQKVFTGSGAESRGPGCGREAGCEGVKLSSSGYS